MVARQLFSSAAAGVVEVVHPVGDDTWNTVRRVTSECPVLLFPRVPVLVRREGDAPRLATPNIALLYGPGTQFEREARDERGDAYLALELREPLLAELGMPWPASTHAPVDAHTYLTQHLLARYLDTTAAIDVALVEETVLWIARAVLTGAQPDEGASRDVTRALHRTLVEEAKAELWSSLGETIGVEELARRLGSSPFHLSRIFKRETGFSVHEYRLQLRLRTGLERLSDSRGSLLMLALQLGFVSHSHFTAAFRRAFGLLPSEARDEHHARRALESGRLLAA